MLKVNVFNGELQCIPAGGGNATVPLNAVIQPPQAFVRYAPGMFIRKVDQDAYYSLDLACDGEVMTYISAEELGYYSRLTTGKPILLTGHALLADNIDAILLELSYNSTTVDLSGPNMGVPSPAVEGLPGIWTVVVVPNGTGTLSFSDGASNTFRVILGAGDSNMNTSSSASDDAAALAAYINNNSSFGWVISVLGATVTIVVGNIANGSGGFPLTIPIGNTTTYTCEITQAGQAFVKNAAISSIVTGGGTVTCLEYNDRVSGDKAQVTYV